MMEIKFKGMSRDADKWVYGGIVVCGQQHLIITQEWDKLIKIPVYPMTVSQYTGIKDINGEEIYKGDIVKCTTNAWRIPKEAVLEVVFMQGMFGIVWPELFGDNDCLKLTAFKVEVLGNALNKQ